MPSARRRIRRWWTEGSARLPLLFADTTPLDLRLVGRTLFHAALIGLGTGIAGVAFFASLELLQTALLEQLAGYAPLRAAGEVFGVREHARVFRPWILVMLPALGGLACGALTRLAPETAGGGGDAMIEAFHHKAGLIRGRVLWVKPIASLLTLGTGGAGGREGPIMQVGGALGSLVSRLLRLSPRERRILLVAGVAGGISAVFRTPLGAALLAVEILYRDGFEVDALVPSIFSSVTAYSVVISVLGESTLFAHAPRFPFVPLHLPLYGLLALVVAAMAAAFVATLRRSRRFFEGLPIPAWIRPGIGGLALGAVATPVVWFVGRRIHAEGQGLGILGGGYGVAQLAISGSPWLQEGWPAVQLLLLLAVGKLIATSLTLGSGGSAGDFAPSLTIGGLVGGAFGRAAHLVLNDPRLDPGAFALVGMGVFYGGIAHVPLAALVLVCELAGNYDLLVPLMLSQGIAFVALRKRALYESQVATQRESPTHRDALLLDIMTAMRVHTLMLRDRPFVTFTPHAKASEMLQRISDNAWQDVFPVVDESGRMIGVVSADTIRVLAAEQDAVGWTVAADLMQAPVAVRPGDDLRSATELLLAHELRELPVVDDQERVVGFIDEAEIAKAYLKAARRAEDSRSPPSAR